MVRQTYEDRIHFHYKSEPDSHMRLAHGVWGGVSPHGEIEMNFYEESTNHPEHTEQTIGADGIPGEERLCGSENERHITRNIHTRLVLNYQTARAVADWLEDRLEELGQESSGDIFDRDEGIKQ